MALVPGIDRLGGLLYKLCDCNENSTVMSHMPIVVVAGTHGAALPAGRAAPMRAFRRSDRLHCGHRRSAACACRCRLARVVSDHFGSQKKGSRSWSVSNMSSPKMVTVSVVLLSL